MHPMPLRMVNHWRQLVGHKSPGTDCSKRLLHSRHPLCVRGLLNQKGFHPVWTELVVRKTLWSKMIKKGLYELSFSSHRYHLNPKYIIELNKSIRTINYIIYSNDIHPEDEIIIISITLQGDKGEIKWEEFIPHHTRCVG